MTVKVPSSVPGRSSGWSASGGVACTGPVCWAGVTSVVLPMEMLRSSLVTDDEGRLRGLLSKIDLVDYLTQQATTPA